MTKHAAVKIVFAILVLGAVGSFSFKKKPAEAREVPVIVDVSQWQEPREINYKKLSAEVDLAIVRVQKGGEMEDIHYKTHIKNFQKYGVPINVYAFVLASDEASAIEEARMFWERTKAYDIATYWIDIEWDVSNDIPSMIYAYHKELKRLVGPGVKVGIYHGVDQVDEYGLDLQRFDGIWLAQYSSRTGDGAMTLFANADKATAIYPCDLHQFTETGRLNGYPKDLDLSRLTYDFGRPLSYFTTKKSP